MYCVKCGVKLAQTESKCPLCNTKVCHPDFQPGIDSLYPQRKLPKVSSGRQAFSGAVLFAFFLPLIISFLSDLQPDGKLSWFGYVAGALAVSYVIFALPLWFRKPNPVIFTPCGFAAAAGYLWYINFAVKGNWFLSFALPVTGALAVITCAVVTLLYYLKKGRLYILGGGMIALGGFVMLIELLLQVTFRIAFTGWSVYPLAALTLLGLLLIYFAVSRPARETVARKLFF